MKAGVAGHPPVILHTSPATGFITVPPDEAAFIVATTAERPVPTVSQPVAFLQPTRSEERRVGKEC